jgi:hypothetical protein
VNVPQASVGGKMWIQQQTKVRKFGAAMILALMGVCSNAAFAAVTASSTSLRFPNQTVGTTSASIGVTIANTSSQSITIENVTSSAPQFSFSGAGTAFTLAPGQSFTANVTFTPTAAQNYNATLTVRKHNGQRLLSVSLSGTGIQGLTAIPALTASASALSFSGVAGGAAPATQSLTIGANPAGAVAFTVSADQAWINLSANSGTTSSAIQVGANTSGLAAGNYSGHVIVSASGVTNSPMSIAVTLSVSAAQTRVLTASPSALAFSAAVGGAAPAIQSVSINNSPVSALPFTVSTDQAWISVSPVSSTTLATLQVGASISGLAAGSYSGHVIVSAAGVANSPMSIPVMLTVAAGQTTSTLTAAPSVISFSGVAGGSAPATQSLTIGENPAGAVPFTVTADQAWMTLSAASGTTSSTIQVGAKTSGLAAGNYTGHVIVSAAGVTNSPMSVTVTLAVTAAPQTNSLTVSPSAVSFSQQLGGAAPAGQYLAIGENPTGAVPFTITGDQPWMVLSFTSGTTPASIQVSTNTTVTNGMAAGNYSGHVIVSAAGMTNSPVSIPVTFAINSGTQTGALSVSPSSVAFGNINLLNNNTKTVTLTNSGTGSVTISSMAVVGAGLSVNGIATPMTLTAGQTTVLSVVFAPTVVGAVNGTISVVSNATNSSSVITATGAGVQPSLTASPSTLNFGSLVTGSSASQTITIFNTGSAAATISQAVISGTGYTMNGLALPMTLAAGASTSLSVQFAPAVAGNDPGSVTVTSNTPNSPTLVALNGAATAPVTHSVSLSWVASTSTVVGYNIYRSSISGGPYALLNSTPNVGVSYTDMAVTAGQTYYYVVTAVDASGNESIVSNEVSATVPTP